MLEHLNTLLQAGKLTDLDVHFGHFITHLANTDMSELMLAACLVSHWTGNGHVCMDLRAASAQPMTGAGNEIEFETPDFNRWVRVLKKCDVIGAPGEFRPLILDEKGRLYLYRYWRYEHQVAEDLRRRSMEELDDRSLERLRQNLQHLFPGENTSSTDWQKVAVAVAAMRRLCVVSGGPGTGKTATVARMLALLLQQSSSDHLRIALTAPTGKAAARLQEAIRLAKQHLHVQEWVRAAIPDQVFTIHRLLGVRFDSVYFRHNRERLLPIDVLVVDEASMVDVALMAKLLDALSPQARLILLGDKHQLSSVEAGSVLGDVCADVPGPSKEFRSKLEAVTGTSLPAQPRAAPPLRDAVVLLRRSYRFDTNSGIARLAYAVNAGDGEAVFKMLEQGGYEDVNWNVLQGANKLPRNLIDVAVTGYLSYLKRITDNAPPKEVIEAFNGFRVLCALRRGPFGVAEINARIEHGLRTHHGMATHKTWYPGRPIMVTRNDYTLQLYNGDLGIALPDPDQRQPILVFFEGADGALRSFSPTRIPSHETAFVMTVHKSQGSEFDNVLLILPPDDFRLLTRELIYTGITRARRRVEIWGARAVVQKAVERKLERSSGLYERLWHEQPFIT